MGFPLHSNAVSDVNQVIGWIYFFAWSLSFYPQVYYNWSRKSVIGLNFDYLFYNVTGFVGYMTYNICLYYVPAIQREYLHKHGDKSTIPVQLNDVFFAVHAVLLTLITVFQCFIYERGGQRVSTFARFLMGFAWLYIIVTLILAFCGLLGLRWVNFLNGISYVKLGVTVVKYVPQAHMNFTRKSTVGWSIGNVLLDFTGGFFSFMQMLLQYFNDGDASIFEGDPVKLGLAFFSMFFDIFFMVQHYVLYPRHADATALAEKQRAAAAQSGGETGASDVTPLLRGHEIQ